MSRIESAEARQLSRSWELFANVVVASCFLLFAYSCAKGFFATYRMSLLLIFIKESLDALFYLCRRLPKQVTTRFSSWITAICGTVAPLLLRPCGMNDHMPGDLLQYGGLCLQIIAIFSLNRSFGIVPANRGIKSHGMYRFVRHPLYSSYAVALTGFVINNCSLQNVLLLLITTGFQVVRIAREEELLSLDGAYQDYSRVTRWKMIPFVF